MICTEDKNYIPEDAHLAKLRNESLEEVVRDDPKVVESAEQLVCRIYYHFKEKQIEQFPLYCQECYRINKATDKMLEEHGNKGKYTDTYGWSEDRTFKNKWVVPQKLHLFMQNLVYHEFWSEANARVRDSFMNQVCMGGTIFDFEQLLKKVVLYYGSNIKDSIGERATGSASIQ